MEGMLAPIHEPLISTLNLTSSCRIADIGCGGSGTTLEIQRRAPAGSVVQGFDLSPTLIELACSRKGSDERVIAFEIADMATASAPEVPYDRLVSRFGIMFFDDSLAVGSFILSIMPVTLGISGYIIVQNGNAYKRDLKAIEYHLLDAGHFDLETKGEEIASLMRSFLAKNIVTK